MAQQIDFNPQPAYGSDPFQPLVEGLNLGLGLQREQRAAQEFQQMQEAKKQQANLEKLNALSSIPNQSWFKSLAKKDKDEFAKSYSGALKGYLGVDIGLPEWNDNYKEYTKRLADILGSSLDNDKKRIATANLLAEAQDGLNKDQASFLKESAEFGLPRGGGDRDLQALRLQNLEQERTQRETERESGRYRQYLLDIEQRDPIIKEANKQNLSLATVGSLSGLVADGNTVAFNALGTKVAKAMGEVGVLTEQDVQRYVRSGRLDRKAADTLSSWIKGRPTDATLAEISQISGAIGDTYQQKLQPRYDRYIEAYSNLEGVDPLVFSKKLGLPYSGSAKQAAPSNNSDIATMSDAQLEAIIRGQQ